MGRQTAGGARRSESCGDGAEGARRTHSMCGRNAPVGHIARCREDGDGLGAHQTGACFAVAVACSFSDNNQRDDEGDDRRSEDSQGALHGRGGCQCSD